LCIVIASSNEHILPENVLKLQKAALENMSRADRQKIGLLTLYMRVHKNFGIALYGYAHALRDTFTRALDEFRVARRSQPLAFSPPVCRGKPLCSFFCLL
jgi:hypothetical protein